MMSEKRSIWEELEAGFGGGTKFRVLTYLILNSDEAFTKYALAKATGLKTASVNDYLKALLEMGWVTEYNFAPQTYQINLNNAIVKRIHEFFQELKHHPPSPSFPRPLK